MGKAVIKDGVMESYEFTMQGHVKITIEEGVRAFGSHCFYQQQNLTTIVLPKSLERLDGWCLAGTGLKELHVPMGTRTVTDFAVMDCKDLKAVWLPHSITELSGFCFQNCPALESVYIAAEGLTFTPGNVFKNCPRVRVMQVDKTTGKPFRTLYTGPQADTSAEASAAKDTFVVRDGVLLEVNLPEGTDFTVTLPSNIHHIGSEALRGKTSITKIIVREGLEELCGWEFAGTSIREIRLPSSVKRIAGHAFDGCTELRDVWLPPAVTHIKDSAFCNCPNLNAVYYSAESVNYEIDAFCNTPKPYFVYYAWGTDHPESYDPVFIVRDGVLEGVRLQDDLYYTLTLPVGIKRLAPDCMKDRRNIIGIILPDGIEELSGYEFSGTGIKEIRLPNSLKRLEGHVFENCPELELVILPEHMDVIKGHLFVDCPKLLYLFYGTQKLTWDNTCFNGRKPAVLHRRPRTERHSAGGMTQKDDLFDIQDGVLMRYFGGKNLTDVVIPEGVECISTACFTDMPHITSVTLPSTLREIVGWEFANTGITEIRIPDNVRDLDGHCFQNCKSLRAVYLPRSMTSFGTEGNCFCFQGCEQLEHVYYAAEKVTYFNAAFNECPNYKFEPMKWDSEPAPQNVNAPTQDIEAEIEARRRAEQEAAAKAAEAAAKAAEAAEKARLAAEAEARHQQEMEELRRQIEEMKAQQAQLQADKEREAAEARHQQEIEEMRKELEAARAEKERIAAEMAHKREMEELEREKAELQRELELEKSKRVTADSSVEDVLKIYLQYETEESKQFIAQHFSDAARLLLNGEVDTILIVMKSHVIATPENKALLLRLAQIQGKDEIIREISKL